MAESADQNQTGTMQSNQPVPDVAVVSEGAQVTQSGIFFQNCNNIYVISVI